MIEPMVVAGVVLAGGQSRRMQGLDKVFADVGGRLLCERAVQRLRPQVGALVISGNGDLARFARFGVAAVADTVEGFQGPLAGVLAGMRWAEVNARSATHLASVSADAPFLPRDLVARLSAGLSQAGGRVRVAAAVSHDKTHPVMALWPLACRDAIEQALARGERKVMRLQEELGLCRVAFADVTIGGEPVDPFFNVNVPEDLARARALAVAEDVAVIGIAGWKNAGKTTLVVRLIAELSRLGYRVASLKRSHHEVQDAVAPGSDTERHRAAGAWRVVLVTPSRWGVVPDLVPGACPPLREVVRSSLEGADIVVVEGCKSADIAKIEVRGSAAGEGPHLAPRDRKVIAIAAADQVDGADVPVFSRDDVTGLARFIGEAVARGLL